MYPLRDLESKKILGGSDLKSNDIAGIEFEQYLLKLLQDTKILTMDKYVQHGKTSCFWHSVAVAYYSVCFAQYFNIRCDMESLIIGALLHDYFLYDWHISDKKHRLHGFTHPNKALINAKRDWQINSIEEKIIKRHMFPLTPIPPTCKESIIVCIIDKYCSIKEIVKKDPYKRLKIKYVF